MDWTLVFNYGAPFAILAAIGFASWKALKWFGGEILGPSVIRVADRTIKFIDELEGVLTKIGTRTETQLGLCQDMNEAHAEGGRCDIGPVKRAIPPLAQGIVAAASGDAAAARGHAEQAIREVQRSNRTGE